MNMNNPLKLKADHISSIYLGDFQVIVLINPKDLEIDIEKIYHGIELIDHGEISHCYKRAVRVIRTTNENYGETDCVQRVVHVYLADV